MFVAEPDAAKDEALAAGPAKFLPETNERIRLAPGNLMALSRQVSIWRHSRRDWAVWPVRLSQSVFLLALAIFPVRDSSSLSASQSLLLLALHPRLHRCFSFPAISMSWVWVSAILPRRLFSAEFFSPSVSARALASPFSTSVFVSLLSVSRSAAGFRMESEKRPRAFLPALSSFSRRSIGRERT